MKKIVAILIILINYSFAFGQNNNYIFKRLSVEDGLSNASVLSIFQDSRGYMWFATIDGLNRFDGYEFKIYRKIHGDTLSLSDNRVLIIYEDSNNNLWIGTSNGLNLFNREQGTFTRFFHHLDNNSISHNHITTIIEDEECLWIGTYGGGINHYDIKSNKFTHFRHDSTDLNSISGDVIWTIFKDSNNNLWFGSTDEGLNLYDRKSKTFTRFKIGDGNNTLNTISDIHEVSENDFLLATDAGLVRYLPFKKEQNFILYQNNVDEPNSISKGRIRRIYRDNSNNLWISASHGQDIFDIEKNNFIHIKSDKKNNQSISTDEVWRIVEDNQGQLWFGTYKGGINILNPGHRHFKCWTHDPKNNKSLINNSVLAFEENQDSTFWLAIDHGGLSLFDRHKGAIKTYVHVPGNKNSLLNNSITSMLLDSKGRLWLGYWAGGLSMFDKIKGQFTHYVPPEFELERWHIWDIHEDDKGNIWTASLGSGISCFNPVTKTFKTYMNIENNEKSLSHNSVWTIFQDSNKNLWFGTVNGLNKLNEEVNDFIYYPYKTSDNVVANSYNVFSLYEDKNKRFWVGTGENGLNLFDTDKGIFKAITEKEGISNNSIHGILEDNNGNIWCSSSRGISKITMDSKNNVSQINNYDKSNGLQDDQFNKGAYYKSVTKELFFGGINGFVFFNPDSIMPNNFKPVVRITGFSIFNETVKPDLTGKNNSPLKKDISEAKEIILTHKQSVFSLKYAALSYISPEKNKYAYKLEGFDEKWNFVGLKREATYTNLDAGTYTFMVKAANNDGVWSDKVTSIEIIILPPWWKTWWFRVLLIFFIIGSSLTFYFNRIKQLKLHQKKLEETVILRTTDLQIANKNLKKAKEKADLANQAKSTFLANMTHEIRTPMNAVLGFSEILSKKIKSPTYQQYLSAIISSGNSLNVLINDILDLSKIEASKIELNYTAVDLKSLIETIVLIFETKVTEKGVDFITEIDKNLPKAILLDQTRTRQILMNLLSNASKFTTSGYVKLKVNCTKKTEALCSIIFSVIDTGIGIPKNQQKDIFKPFVQQKGQSVEKFGGTGLGLPICIGLAKKMNGKILLKSEKGKGSEFSLLLNNVEITNKTILNKSEYSNNENIVFDKAKVLIADDIKINRDLLKTYLHDFEFDIIEAENGEEAVNLSKKHLPQLILIDIRMPKLNGIEASKILKKGPETKNLPIIAVSASATTDERAQILSICTDFIAKPISYEKLLIVLKKYLKHIIVTETIDDKQKLVPESVNNKQIIKPKELCKKLKENIEPQVEKLKNSLILNDVIALSDTIEQNYKKYNYIELINWADVLKTQAKCVNLKGVKNSLDLFADIQNINC